MKIEPVNVKEEEKVVEPQAFSDEPGIAEGGGQEETDTYNPWTPTPPKRKRKQQTIMALDFKDDNDNEIPVFGNRRGIKRKQEEPETPMYTGDDPDKPEDDKDNLEFLDEEQVDIDRLFNEARSRVLEREKKVIEHTYARKHLHAKKKAEEDEKLAAAKAASQAIVPPSILDYGLSSLKKSKDIVDSDSDSDDGSDADTYVHPTLGDPSLLTRKITSVLGRLMPKLERRIKSNASDVASLKMRQKMPTSSHR